MRVYSDKLVIRRGESFSLTHHLAPLVVAGALDNPYFKVTLVDDLYATDKNAVYILWLPYEGRTFNHTNVINCDNATFYHVGMPVSFSEFKPGANHYIVNNEGSTFVTSKDDYILSRTVNGKVVYYAFTPAGGKTEYTLDITVSLNSDDTNIAEQMYNYSIDLVAGASTHAELVAIAATLGIGDTTLSDETLSDKILAITGRYINPSEPLFNYESVVHICDYDFIVEAGTAKVGKR